MIIKEENSLEAFDVLEKRYENMIFSITAKHFKANNVGHALRVDAIEEGERSLLKAAIKYDFKKGVKFANYAWNTIEGNIQNYKVENKLLVCTPAMQKRLNKLEKVVEVVKVGLNLNDKNIIDIIKNNRKQVMCLLRLKYPKENWDKFFDETSKIVTLAEISMDETMKEANDRKKISILSLQQLLEDREPSGQLLVKESLDIFKNIYVHWMSKILSLYCENRRNHVYSCLKIYYIKSANESDIIQYLSSLGYNGYSYFRKIKNRFEKDVSKKYPTLIHIMVNELNKHFDNDFKYIYTEGSLYENFKNFCESIRELG